jgi:uncharacterized DUF497 family protein
MTDARNPDDRYFEYEWDENKNQKNIQKHGIDFEDAIAVFNDRARIDTNIVHSSGELRIGTIGEIEPGHVFVVFTWRHNNTTRRIISARKAPREERVLYFHKKPVYYI